MVGEGCVHPKVQRLFKGLSRLCGQYQLARRAEHCTQTSVVHRATDLDGSPVAIKFMTMRKQLEVEVESRSLLPGFEESGAVVRLRAHTNDGELGKHASKFRREAQELGYGPYGIVMDAMDRNLAVATLQESLSPAQVADIMRTVVQCVQRLHQHAERIHGDLKQANIMRSMDGQHWKLIDLDCSCKVGETANPRASMAYCAPELARHMLMPSQVPCPVAHPSLDVWSIGVILFELLSRHVLFPRNARTDDIEDVAAQQQLCMWLCPTPAMLQRVLGQVGGVGVQCVQEHDTSPGMRMKRLSSENNVLWPSDKNIINDAKKSSTRWRRDQPSRNQNDVKQDKSIPAVHLVQWCLQGDPRARPSVEQLLSHPFLRRRAPWEKRRWQQCSPKKGLRQLRQRTHAFISHFQIEAAGEASRIFKALENCGATGWLDMHADDLTLAGMRAGVENADMFVLLLTSNVLTRPFCIKEFEWALTANKPIVILVEEEKRFFPWSYEEWKQNKIWDNTNSQWVPAIPAAATASSWEKFTRDNGSVAWLNTTTGKWRSTDPSLDNKAACTRAQMGLYDTMAAKPAHKRIRDKVCVCVCLCV